MVSGKFIIVDHTNKFIMLCTCMKIVLRSLDAKNKLLAVQVTKSFLSCMM